MMEQNSNLSAAERKTLTWMQFRLVGSFGVIALSLFVGLYLLITSVDGDGMDVTKMIAGFALLVVVAFGIYFAGPLTKAEKELNLKLNPSKVEPEDERIERVARGANERRKALAFCMWFFFVVTAMAVWAFGLELLQFAAIPFVLGIVCGVFSELKTKNEMEALRAQETADNKKELEDFREANKSFLRADLEVSFSPYTHNLGRWGIDRWVVDRMISFSRGMKDCKRLDSECLDTTYGIFRTYRWENYAVLDVDGEEPVLYIY